MSTGMSFGGGFAEGLASALSQKRQQDQQNKERQISHLFDAMGYLSDKVGDFADLAPLWDKAIELGAFGDPKAMKKGQPGVQDHAANILGHIIRNSKGGVEGRGTDAGPMIGTTPLPSAIQPQGPTGPNDAGEMIPPTELPSTGLPHPAPAAPPRRTLLGIPLLSQEERIARDTDRQTQALSSQIEARRRIADKLGLQGEHAQRFALTGQFPIDPLSRIRPQSIAGEVVGSDGTATPAFAVFTNGQYVDPDTGQPIEGFRPRTTTGSKSYGADREAISLESEFGGKPYSQQSPDMREKINAEVTKRAADRAGATTTARTEAAAKGPLSANQRFAALRDLQNDWRKAEAPEKETQRQFQIMQTGLKRFQEGDKIGGSQAVLVTFQKILDPNSVVRESEYDRSPEGLGLKQRMQGYMERLVSGGAGVPIEELQAMVETANQFVKGMADYNALERERITQGAKEAGLDPARVFGVAAAPVGAGASKTTTSTPADRTAKSSGFHFDADGNAVDNATGNVIDLTTGKAR